MRAARWAADILRAGVLLHQQLVIGALSDGVLHIMLSDGRSYASFERGVQSLPTER
jgi:hypothetical protein